MKAGRWNIVEEKQGSHYSLALEVCDDEEGPPADLTGYGAVMKVKYSTSASSAVLIEASTANGKITMGGTPFNLLADFELSIPAGKYVYDLVLISADGKHWPILTGRFEIEGSTV